MSLEESTKPFQHEPTMKELMDFAVKRGFESYSVKGVLELWRLCGATEVVVVVNGVSASSRDESTIKGSN